MQKCGVDVRCVNCLRLSAGGPGLARAFYAEKLLRTCPDARGNVTHGPYHFKRDFDSDSLFCFKIWPSCPNTTAENLPLMHGILDEGVTQSCFSVARVTLAAGGPDKHGISRHKAAENENKFVLKVHHQAWYCS